MEQDLKVWDRIITASFIGFVMFSIFSITLTQLSGAIGGLAWFAKSRLSGNKAKWPLGIPWLLYALACVLAVGLAVNVGQSYKSLKKLLEFFIFFWTVNCLADTNPSEFFFWLGSRFAPGPVRMFFASIGKKSGSVSPREFFFILLIASVSLAALYGFGQALITGVSRSTRVAGTLSHYMTFAGMLMMVGLMILSRLLFGNKLEPWAGVALGTIVFCMLLTLTRQAWLGFVVGMFFLIFIRERKLLLALPVLVILLQLFAPTAVNQRIASFTNLKDDSFLTRVALWRGGWEIFKDHPLTGCGFKCVDSVYSQYPEHATVLARYKGMHNTLLQVAIDTGIVGVMTWISLWVCYLLALQKLTTPSTPNKWINLGCTSVVLGFLAGGLFEVNFYDSEVVMLLYFLMALPFATSTAASSDDLDFYASSDHAFSKN